MAFRFSTGLRNRILNQFAADYAGGAIAVYTGVQPATPDDPATGTFLGYISKDGNTWVSGDPTNGLTFQTAADGVISKNASEVWRITAVAAGRAGWARHIPNAPADDNSLSTTLYRQDMSIGVTTGNLQMTVIDFQIGTNADVTVYEQTFPVQGSN